MEIAVNEMKYSRSQGRSKPDPMVGVVVVSKKGEKIFQNHRSYYNLQEHGEYTLLQKNLSNEDLTGCTVYVTLEPCIERNPPKQSCSRWIVERGISRVVIGILDPNPTIYNKGVTYLKRYGIIVDFFDYDLADEIRIYNKDFIDYMERINEKDNKDDHEDMEGKDGKEEGGDMEKYDKMEALSHEEERPIAEATLADLSKDAIREYLRAKKLKCTIGSKEFWKEFMKSKYMVERNNKKVPTLAGIVLFGIAPQKFITDHYISPLVFVSDLEGERSLKKIKPGKPPKNISGPIKPMIEDAIEFYKKHAKKGPRLNEFQKREYNYEYPPDVIREALVNALVHRDYGLGSHISFEIFADAIQIASPGQMPKGNTLDDANAFRVRSIRRNTKIAEFVDLLGYMERKQFGIPGMPNELKEYGLKPPKFAYDHGFLVVTFFGRKRSEPLSYILDQYRDQLDEKDIRILEFIREKGRIKSKDVQDMFEVTRETANQYIKKLLHLKLLEVKGQRRGTFYVLHEI